MSEWASIIQSIAEVLIPVVGAWATYELRTRTGLIKDDQERAAVMQAIDTSRLLLQKKLAQGVIRPSDITPGSMAIMSEANAALGRVPNAASSQGTTVGAAATMIAARVNETVAPGVKP